MIWLVRIDLKRAVHLLDMLIMFVTVTLLGMNDKLAKLLVQVVVTVLNYIFSKFLVFGKAKDEAP